MCRKITDSLDFRAKGSQFTGGWEHVSLLKHHESLHDVMTDYEVSFRWAKERQEDWRPVIYSSLSEKAEVLKAG